LPIGDLATEELSGMHIGKFLPDLYIERSPTQSDINQMLY